MARTKTLITVVLALLVLSLPSVTFAQTNEKAKSVQADKGRYKQLLRDIKKIDAEFTKVRNQAVAEAKKDGKASLETKSRLIALSDKRDRYLNRIMLISLRHGWEMPSSEVPDTNNSQFQSEKEEIFQAANDMIKQQFEQEARQIAKTIALPIISKNTLKETKQEKKPWISL